jgi:hypothetical protein
VPLVAYEDARAEGIARRQHLASAMQFAALELRERFLAVAGRRLEDTVKRRRLESIPCRSCGKLFRGLEEAACS